MQSAVPKQFIELDGTPVLMRTINRFVETYPNIMVIITVPQEHIVTWKNLCEKHNFNVPHEIAIGGKERFNSVQNGIRFTSGDAIIGIHDGVRPFVSKEVIKQCFDHLGAGVSINPNSHMSNLT